MASSNNALWIGAIVIVAALTAIEFMSTRDNADDADTAELISSNTDSGSMAPVSPQFDAGKLAMGTAETTTTINGNNTSLLTDNIESGFQFDTESEFASNLIVDLDNPHAQVAAITRSLRSQPETDTAEASVLSTKEEMTEKPTLTEAADNSASIHPFEQTEVEETPAHSNISQHLAAAEEAIKALRMTTPAGDNAYEHYLSVLAIDPDNAEAHAGIEKMVDMYIYFTEKAIVEDQLNTARVYLQRAEHLRPGSPKLKNLRAELD